MHQLDADCALDTNTDAVVQIAVVDGGAAVNVVSAVAVALAEVVVVSAAVVAAAAAADPKFHIELYL